MLRLWRPLSLARNARKPFNAASMTTLHKIVDFRPGVEAESTRANRIGRPSKPGPSSSLNSLNTPVDYAPEAALPPRVILEAGVKSGALKMSADEALELLRRYQERQKRASTGWQEQLCKEFDIEPETLYMLSLMLLKARSWPHRHLSHRLMMSASALRYEPATNHLVELGLRADQLKFYEKPLHHLEVMAKSGNPRAMTLLARVMGAKNRPKEALGLLQKALRGPAGLEFEGAGETLVFEGQLLFVKGDKEGAVAAFRTAALELDNPSAYYYLAELEQEGSPSQTVYYMKAASSGIREAAHKLGCIELSKATKASDGKSAPDYRMAREWFQLGAEGGYRESMASLGKICIDSGEIDEGERWLEKSKTRNGP